jgi:hypothetical protein
MMAGMSGEGYGLWAWLRKAVDAERGEAQHVIDSGAADAHWSEMTSGVLQVSANGTEGDAWYGTWAMGDSRVTRFIAAHDPAAVIAGCEAKLGILEAHYILHRDDPSESYEQFCVMPYSGPHDYGCVTCNYRSMGAVEGRGYCFTLRMLGSAYRTRPGYDEEWLPFRLRSQDSR